MATVFDEFKNYSSWVTDYEGRPNEHAGTTPGANADSKWFLCEYLSFGDYDKSCHIERSNVRVWEDEFAESEGKWWVKVTGMFGYECIAIKGECDDEEILERLEHLHNYPCMNDDDASQLEYELIYNSWDSFTYREWIKACQKIDISPIDIEKSFLHYLFVDEDGFWDEEDFLYYDMEELMLDAWNQWSERENKYAQVQMGGNVYIPMPKD
jgi:hypothetical protein